VLVEMPEGTEAVEQLQRVDISRTSNLSMQYMKIDSLDPRGSKRMNRKLCKL
jgi:hypothetical protein